MSTCGFKRLSDDMRRAARTRALVASIQEHQARTARYEAVEKVTAEQRAAEQARAQQVDDEYDRRQRELDEARERSCARYPHARAHVWQANSREMAPRYDFDPTNYEQEMPNNDLGAARSLFDARCAEHAFALRKNEYADPLMCGHAVPNESLLDWPQAPPFLKSGVKRVATRAFAVELDERLRSLTPRERAELRQLLHQAKEAAREMHFQSYVVGASLTRLRRRYTELTTTTSTTHVEPERSKRQAMEERFDYNYLEGAGKAKMDRPRPKWWNEEEKK